MNERQPYGNVGKSALLARNDIERQKQLLTDQLFRNSLEAINRTQELVRDHQHLKRLLRILCGRYQFNDDHEKRRAEDAAS
jgi:hypothetical protein